MTTHEQTLHEQALHFRHLYDIYGVPSEPQRIVNGRSVGLQEPEQICADEQICAEEGFKLLYQTLVEVAERIGMDVHFGPEQTLLEHIAEVRETAKELAPELVEASYADRTWNF